MIPAKTDRFHQKTDLVLLLLFFAIFLYGSALAIKPNYTTKPLLIKVIADQSYASQKDWSKKARDHILISEDAIRDLLGVQIRIVDYEVWRHEPINDITILTTRMINEVDPGQADILIGFTVASERRKEGQLRKDGLTIPYRGFMVQTEPGGYIQNEFLPIIILHEMIHIFGGVHIKDGSIMAPVYDKEIQLVLDPLNSSIIEITRNVDLKKGISSLSRKKLEKLAELYKRATRLGNNEISTLLELGSAYDKLEMYNEAIRTFREVIRKDMSLAYAWDCIGHCYHKMGQITKAISIFEDALNKTSEKGLFYSRLAVLHFNSGDYLKAKQCAKKAEKNGAQIDATMWNEFRRMGI